MAKQGAGRRAEFEAQAQRAQRSSSGPVAEFWHYLRRSGKWWITPILAALLLIGALVVIGGTSAAPVIYALF
jgi:hypothetical protein